MLANSRRPQAAPYRASGDDAPTGKRWKREQLSTHQAPKRGVCRGGRYAPNTFVITDGVVCNVCYVFLSLCLSVCSFSLLAQGMGFIYPYLYLHCYVAKLCTERALGPTNACQFFAVAAASPLATTPLSPVVAIARLPLCLAHFSCT